MNGAVIRLGQGRRPVAFNKSRACGLSSKKRHGGPSHRQSGVGLYLDGGFLGITFLFREAGQYQSRISDGAQYGVLGRVNQRIYILQQGKHGDICT
jgi:hypothetical protein